MPLMSVCQTPPQSAASSMSLVNDNPFLNLLNTSISSSTNNEASETPAAAAAASASATLLPPPKVPQKNESITDLNAFKTQLKIEHDRLKENLRDSYQRLRLNQTKYFQSHIRRHLSKKANDEKVTTTTTNTTPQIDDTSIDLLNSVLTSNATTTPTPTPNVLLSSLSLPTNQTRLIDDIQYELLKQNEDKSHKRSNYLKELNLNVKKMKRSSCTTRIRRGELKVKQINENDSDQTESDECSSDDSSDENEFIDVVSESSTEKDSESQPVSTTANAYWLMRRVQLGCEWQRVQVKMKMLQQKNKQCNDFIHSHNSLIKSFDAKLVKSTKLIEKLESSCGTTKQVDSHQLASSTTAPPLPLSNEIPIEKAAIDALSNELQECVAVINRPTDDRENNESQQQQQQNNTNNNQVLNGKSIATNSRCSTESRNVNLFNLTKCGDMISFNDEDLCNSLKCALTYFRENLFKTACLCETSSGVKKRKSSNSQISNRVANVKTCIFCHLFKTYENNRKLINETETTPTTPPAANTCDQKEECSPAPNLSNILYEHSYCKQPKVSMIKKAKAKSLKNDKKIITTTTKLVDFDDGLQLDKVVTERLNRLFESKKNSYKTLFDDDYELDLKQDESMIEAGFDLSPSDIKKLPNLSYEE